MRQVFWTVLVGVTLCTAQDPPLFVHLALTGSSQSIVVSWFTRNETATSTVRFGLESGNLERTAVGTSRSYSTTVGWTHDAEMSQLLPSNRYFYVVGDELSGWSSEYNFTSSRNTDEKTPTSVAAVVPMYGDMGAGSNSAATALRLASLAPSADFFYHVGDISYADDVESSQFEATWEEWFNEMEPVLPYAPYMVCPGNHEHASGKPELPYTEYFRVFNYRFSMPWQQCNSSTNSSMWYSFDYGGIHFISISTETDYLGSEYPEHFGDQGVWLQKDLEAASANRKNVPWIVAVGHRPLYSSDPSPYVKLFMPALRLFVEDLFHQYKVDLFVCGHVHSYERSYPMYKGQPTSKSYVNPEGLVQVVSGAAGCVEGSAPLVSPGSWSAHTYYKGWGYGVLQVHNSTTLEWKYYRSADNGMEDTFTIVKS